MKNYIIISLLFLSLGFSQVVNVGQIDIDELIEMDNGLYTIKFKGLPITGTVFDFFGSSERVFVGEIINGKKVGSWKTYWSNGRLKNEIIYYDGKQHGKSTWYFENGKISGESNHINGKFDGKSVQYYMNGQVTYLVYYKDGLKQDGKWFSYYEDGQIEWEKNIKNGKNHGKYIKYYKSGQKHGEWNYKDGELISSKEWNRDGSVKY